MSGTVTGIDGPVDSGLVAFFATCEDYKNQHAAGFDWHGPGTYTVTVPDGTYRVLISPTSQPGAAGASWHRAKPDCEQATVVTISGDTTLNLVATAAPNVTGTVSTATGPVSAGSVSFYATCGDYQDEIVADKASVVSGEYSAGLADGTYRVHISPASDSAGLESWHSAKATCAEATVVTVNGNTSLDLVARAGVTGTITTSSGPVDSGLVAFFATCEDYKNQHAAGFDWHGPGTYTVTVPDGTYRVLISPTSQPGAVGASWHSAKPTCEQATVVTISGDTTLNLVALPTVTGTVSTSQGPVTSGQLAFYVTCQDLLDGKPAASVSWSGSFTIALADGTYRVLISPNPGTGAIQSWHSAKANCGEATVVSVYGNTSLALVARTGVTGTVSSSNGPVVGGYVAFYASCEDYDVSQSRYAASASIANGSYSVNVPEGSYRVLIWPNRDTGALESWHNAEPSCAEATVVTVSGDTTLDLVALPGSDVTGTVSSSNGLVASGSAVFYATCQAYQDGDAAGYGYIDAGTYTATVPDGTYRVRIFPDSGSGAVESWHSAKATCAEAAEVTVSGGTTLDLVALPGSDVTGTVSTSTGPVSAGSVAFYATCQDYDDGGAAGFSEIIAGTYTATAPDGTYRVRISPDSGSGAVESWHSAKATCAEAAVVTISGDTTLDLVALPGSDVTGTVSTSNGPVSAGSVVFYASCQHYRDGEAAAFGQWNTAWGESGYTVTVPDGTYRVHIHAVLPVEVYSWHNAKPSCAEASMVTIAGDTTLDLVASVGRAVTGTVASSKGPVTSGMVVFVPNCEEQMAVSNHAFIDAGTYTAAVPDGTYRVWISPHSGSGAALSWHSAKAACAEADVVTIAGDTTLDIIAMAAYDVTGTVSTSSGPVSAGSVAFYSTCQHYDSGDAAGYARIDVGTYTATVPEGAYRVQISPDSGTGGVESWHSAKATCAEADVVTISGDTPVNLVALVELAPQPIPSPPASSPTPAPPPASPGANPGTLPPTPVTPLREQSVVGPVKKLSRGKKAKLARATKQGARLAWRTSTKRVCRVSKYKVTGLRKGKCRLRASAPVVDGFAPFVRAFTIRVR